MTSGQQNSVTDRAPPCPDRTTLATSPTLPTEISALDGEWELVFSDVAHGIFRSSPFFLAIEEALNSSPGIPALGKWLGLVLLNMVLLTIGGVSIFTFNEYLRTRPSANPLDALAVEDEILTARVGILPIFNSLPLSELRERARQRQHVHVIHPHARVVAVASSEAKLAAAKALGADHCLDYSNCSDGKELKALLKEAAGSGFDVAVDPVGDFYSEPAIRSMGWGGRSLVIGFAAGSIPKVPLNLPLLKNCSLMGVFWGAWAARESEANLANFELLAQWHNEGKLRPLISERFSLDDAAKAIETLDSRRAKGKLIVVPGPPEAKL